MNSDPVLRELRRLANDQRLTHTQRQIAVQAIQHIRLQDDELQKLRDDVSEWEDPDGNPPAAA